MSPTDTKTNSSVKIYVAINVFPILECKNMQRFVINLFWEIT